MRIIRGLFLAPAILCAGGAQAAPLEMQMHTPTIHEVNPQPLPPGASGSGMPNETFGLSYGKMKMQYHQQQNGTGYTQAARLSQPKAVVASSAAVQRVRKLTMIRR